jgi:hypothetical protein
MASKRKSAHEQLDEDIGRALDVHEEIETELLDRSPTTDTQRLLLTRLKLIQAKLEVAQAHNAKMHQLIFQIKVHTNFLSDAMAELDAYNQEEFDFTEAALVQLDTVLETELPKALGIPPEDNETQGASQAASPSSDSSDDEKSEEQMMSADEDDEDM